MAILPILPIMEFVTVDALGRILIPKPLRKQLNLKPGSRLVAVPSGRKLVLQEMDLQAWANALAKEFEGVDIDRVARESREMANREAADFIASIRSGHERPGWRGPASAYPNDKLPPRRKAPRRTGASRRQSGPAL